MLWCFMNFEVLKKYCIIKLGDIIMLNLTSDQTNQLIETLKLRFESNMSRHPDVKWNQILEKISNVPNKLWALYEMERTGGEPDVVIFENKSVFIDCSKESPEGRRNVCYDAEALESRKKFKPKTSALSMAKDMGIELLNESEYKHLQTLGDFDLKTSSWIDTPNEIRKLGGALFGDKRYNNTYIYHNGAESYYSSRGFRGLLKI